MAFDPDQYLKGDSAPKPQGSSGGFDPDAYLSGKSSGQSEAPDKYTPAASAALEHFGNGAAMGYLPQLQAAAEPVMNRALDAITGNNVSDDEPDYAARRDENVKRLQQQEQAYPKASLAGTVGGALAGGVAMSPALGAVPGLRGLSAARAAEGAGLAGKATALGQRTLGAMGQGAIMGAAFNPGDTEGEVDPLQLGDRAKNAAVSGMISAPLHIAGEGLGAAAEAVGDKLKSGAEKLAYRALGPRKRFALQDADQVNDIGREALDSGVVKWRPTNAEGLAERATDAKQAAGQKIEDVVSDLASKDNVPSLSRQEMASNLRKHLIADESIPGVAEKNAKINALIDELEQGGGPLSLSDARTLKKGVSDQVKWDRLPGADIPPTEEFHRGLYSELKRGEEGIADSLAKSGQIENGDRFLKAKQSYGNLSRAERIAQDKAGAERANQILGLKDTIAGGVGAGIGAYAGEKLAGHEGMKAGAIIGGGIGAAGNKLARTYGSQVAAKGTDALGNFIAKSPALAEFVAKNPGIGPAMIQDKLRQNGKPKDEIPPGFNPEVIKMVRERPELIDTLDDESLKGQLRKFISRSPADSGFSPEDYVSKDEAKEQYLTGH